MYLPLVYILRSQCLEAAQEYIQKRFTLSLDNGPIDLMGVTVCIQSTVQKLKKTNILTQFERM